MDNLNDEQKKSMKERLRNIILKKLETTMIFPLSQFELDFGHLWGYGKDPSELTTQEKFYQKKWKACREKILDNGNRQKRGFNAEFDMHTIIWNRYGSIFTLGDRK